MFSSKTLLAAYGLVGMANAHMILAEPKPFAGVINSPLAADGSNFPCQAVAYTGTPTSMSLGSSQPLSFTGGATHGGGSCQISLTYDTSPTKNSVWKVIHSIEGGCPVKNTAGNIGSDASAADPFTYTFPIPSDIPTGTATIAWTWLNRIGNREFYMNCAPVELTGTSGSKSSYDALPDMLVANIAAGGGSSCATTEGFDYMYPNPGSSVDRFNMTELKYPVGAGCGTPGSSGSSSGSGSGSGSATTADGGAATTATAAPKSTTAASAPGGVFITQSAPAASVPSSTAAPAAESPTTTTAAAQASAISSTGRGSGSSGSGSGSGTSGTSAGAQTVGAACTTEGEWNCVGGTSFQRCASGTWSAIMQMAAGTTCTIGQSAAIDIVTSGGKKRRVAIRFRG